MREAWLAARLQASSVAARALACSGEGTSLTRTVTFMIEHASEPPPMAGRKPRNFSGFSWLGPLGGWGVSPGERPGFHTQKQVNRVLSAAWNSDRWADQAFG